MSFAMAAYNEPFSVHFLSASEPRVTSIRLVIKIKCTTIYCSPLIVGYDLFEINLNIKVAKVHKHLFNEIVAINFDT